MNDKAKQPPSRANAGRGKRASFERRTGEVSGSGSGVGNPAGGEDYDNDLSIGSGAAPKTGGPSNAA